MTNREFVEKFLVQMMCRGWIPDRIYYEDGEVETIYYLPITNMVDMIFDVDLATIVFTDAVGNRATAMFIPELEGEEVLAEYTNIDEIEKTLKGMGYHFTGTDNPVDFPSAS